MANRFVLNETSYHGAGAIQEIATEVKGRGFKKAFVCSDPDLIKFNVTKKVTDVLDNAGIDYEIYSNIKANPTIENVQARLLRRSKQAALTALLQSAAAHQWIQPRQSALSSRILNLQTFVHLRELPRQRTNACLLSQFPPQHKHCR